MQTNDPRNEEGRLTPETAPTQTNASKATASAQGHQDPGSNQCAPRTSGPHRVGANLIVCFRVGGAPTALQAEWSPRPPTAREWKRVIGRYRAARDAFLLAAFGSRGGTVAVLEVAP